MPPYSGKRTVSPSLRPTGTVSYEANCKLVDGNWKEIGKKLERNLPEAMESVDWPGENSRDLNQGENDLNQSISDSEEEHSREKTMT